MRIKWTSIPNVISSNSAAPWVGPGLAERLKQEAMTEREPNKDKKETKKKAERALAWLRRSR
jgi:hypothetical protein